MNLMKLMMALGASFILTCAANATITWNFGGNPGLVTPTAGTGGGTSYTTTAGTITVYGEQVNSSGALQTIPDSTLCTKVGANNDCLFQTNTSHFPDGTGIAPYNPQQTTNNYFSGQSGITENNILELELGSDITSGTTLSFLLQSGVYAYNNDTVTVYYDVGASTPQNLGNMMVLNNPTNNKPSNTNPIGGISTTGTMPQFSITKTGTGTEFVAIQSDCVYLLLDTVTTPSVTTSSVPEPKFYGWLLAGAIGLASLYRRRRLQKA